MHLYLTDRLTCPRCGPEFGLILLAEEVRERRILRGEFGCANCREKYPVAGGFADLRPPPRGELRHDPSFTPPGEEGPREEDPLRLAALLGVTEGPGSVLVTGPAAMAASALSELLGEVEVVAMGPVLRDRPEESGVSRLVSGPRFPFYSQTFRGVILSGTAGAGELDEGVRVTAPRARLVVLSASEGLGTRLEENGFAIVLGEEGVLVAERMG